MNRVALFAVATGAALVGAGYLLRRGDVRLSPLGSSPDVIPIVAPFIDVSVADGVLAAMDRLRGDRVTLVLHTLGGCVTACVLISNALRQFRESVAVVPYMAISGGTLIALNAGRLEMGRYAALSAVDPMIMGQRVRHLAELDSDKSVAALAREYEVAMQDYLRDTLRAHVPEAKLKTAMGLFLGEHAPHAWPIRRAEIEAVGIPVKESADRWSGLIDGMRGRMRVRMMEEAP